MRGAFESVLSSILLVTAASSANAQSLPTSQPAVLLIQIEHVALGHGGAHRANESGWPAAYESVKSPYSYLALEAITGTPQVWFVSPYASYAQMDEDFRQTEANRELGAELARLRAADAEHLTKLETLQAVSRPDLSHGAFPDVGTQRYWEIATFELEAGGAPAFEAAAKAYGAAAGRAAPGVSYRVYEVVAGGASPTYLVFSSIASLGEFDQSYPNGMSVMKALSPQEQEAMARFGDAVERMETQRFRLDPAMSYVPRSVREQDPDFWLSER